MTKNLVNELDFNISCTSYNTFELENKSKLIYNGIEFCNDLELFLLDLKKEKFDDGLFYLELNKKKF